MNRWFLYAEPLPPGELDPELQPVSEKLAKILNEKPERFLTRRGARRAAKFYTENLRLPVTLEAVQELDRGETA